jgi:Rod binding domain-containing protein
MNVAQITSSLSATPTRELTAAGTADRRSPNTAAERKKVAAQFEAVLVRQLLSQSVGSMLGGGDAVSGTIYGDMMTDALAQKLTAGPGLGLGRFIEKQLTPRGAPVDSSAGKHPGAKPSA